MATHVRLGSLELAAALFTQQLPAAPTGLHDDFVDATSRAFIEIDERGWRGRLADWARARI